jgi:adenosylcobyric acid synthase
MTAVSGVPPRGPALMVCGTASDVGKSRIVTGLCRAFARRGLDVAPFKGQNMALNSVVTPDGDEIGRAQGTQAQAAGVAPEAAMNPVLLKPTSDRRSQVVVLGRPWRELDAVDYQQAKGELRAVVLRALSSLRSRHDVVVCEGAGSPAEINLLEDDLVNLGLAATAGIPAILVGDIDRGGVFAHLYGTVALLPSDRRRMVRGFVVNKLRGDPALLGDATRVLERRCGIPTLGVLPHIDDLWLDAEDSLGLGWPSPSPHAGGGAATLDVVLDVVVVRLPRISNFTDIDPIAAEPGVGVRLVDHPAAMGDPDLVVLPGSKSTVADLEWLRRQALDRALARCLAQGATVVGICGGFQMLGERIEDPEGVESRSPSISGLGLVSLTTRFAGEKVTALRAGNLAGSPVGVVGYEVHHGRHRLADGAHPWFELDEPGTGDASPEGVADVAHGIYGTVLHGLFEADGFRAAFLRQVAERRRKAWTPSGVSFRALREAQIDRLADACEAHLDVDGLLKLAEEAE